jgi:hypothetical protein
MPDIKGSVTITFSCYITENLGDGSVQPIISFVDGTNDILDITYIGAQNVLKTQAHRSPTGDAGVNSGLSGLYGQILTIEITKTASYISDVKINDVSVVSSRYSDPVINLGTPRNYIGSNASAVFTPLASLTEIKQVHGLTEVMFQLFSVHQQQQTYNEKKINHRAIVFLLD